MLFRISSFTAAGVCIVLALSGCTATGDSTGDAAEPTTHSGIPAQAYAGRLPDMCDDLISPVWVARLLNEADPVQRTYTYDAPGALPDLDRGMTCEHGVRPDGTTLTVSAQEFNSRSAAMNQYREARSKDAPARDIRVSRRPSVLAVSTPSPSLFVLDGKVTVNVLLHPATSPPGWGRRTLLACAKAVIARVDGATSTSQAHATPGVTSRPVQQVTNVEDFRYVTTAKNPSGDKPQSKLWYAHGSWWGVLAASARSTSPSTRIYRLVSHHWKDTGTVVDPRPASTADVLWDGRKLYVASRSPSARLAVARFSFDRDDKAWSLDDGFPVRLGTGSSSATLAEDSTRKLWVTYTANRRVWVAHTTNDDRTWTAPFRLGADTPLTADDISAIVSFGSKIGVMWSDQRSNMFRFAVHQDGSRDSTWSQEAAQSGLRSADDHMHLATIPSASGPRVIAAVKTSVDEIPGVLPTDNQIEVLVRSVGGKWRALPAGTVQDGPTRPILAVDTTNRQLYLVSASFSSGMYYKHASFARLAFDGTWNTLIPPSSAPGVDNPTSSKSAVSARTGLVVLSSEQGSRRYYHSELSLGSAVDDDRAPMPPGFLDGVSTQGCQINLVWTQATDNVGVERYVIRRDGSYLTSTADTNFTDSSVDCGSKHSYSVSAVDAANNRSADNPNVKITAADALRRGRGIWLRSTTTVGGNGGARIDAVSPPTRPGDLVLASVSAVGTAPVTPPPGWHLVQRNVAGGAMSMATYSRLATGHETSEYSWNLAGRRHAVLTVQVYAGVAANHPVAEASGQQSDAGSAEVTLPAVDVVAPGRALIGFFAVAAKAALSAPPEMAPTAAEGVAGDGSVVASGSGELLNVGVPQRSMVAKSSRAGLNIGQIVVLKPSTSK